MSSRQIAAHVAVSFLVLVVLHVIGIGLVGLVAFVVLSTGLTVAKHRRAREEHG